MFFGKINSVLFPILLFFSIAYFAFAIPSITFIPPTLNDSVTTQSDWVYVNITSSESLSAAFVEWGSSLGFTNFTMSNTSLTNFYRNITNLTDGMYNYSIWAQNTTGDWNQTERRYVTVDNIPPYNISACQELTIENGSYILVQNVSSFGTCFTIKANNITLDGAGYTINYSMSSIGYAVNNSLGYNFTVIKNMDIVQGSTSSYSYAICFNMSSNGDILDNTIATLGSTSPGVILDASGANTISNNTITTFGEYGYGIYFDSSNTNNISNNTITTSSSNSYGIYSASSNNNTLTSNTITTSSSNSNGIYLRSYSNSNTLSSNTITTSGSFGNGILLNIYSNSNTLSSNTITTSGWHGDGIYTADSSYNTLSNNTITIGGLESKGIHSYSSITNNISNNTITTFGSYGYGIYFDSSNTNNILYNTITTSGHNGNGILFTSSNNSIFWNNTINTSGSSGHGIYFDSSNTNNISYNTITTSNSSSSGIYLESHSNSNVLSNNRITTANSYAHGIILWSSSLNSIAGGSIVLTTNTENMEYILMNAGATNNFTNTNFTTTRKIYLLDNISWFNYNNETNGNIWLKTKASASVVLSRTLINWSNTTMQWNDTNSTDSGIITTYNITGLKTNTTYNVFNSSKGIQTNSHVLATDANGNLPSFTIALNNNTELIVTLDTLAPEITINSPVNASSIEIIDATSTTLTITTNEEATCRYYTNSTFDYVNGTDFTSTGGTVHTQSYGGLSDGQSYSLYYKCNDTTGNANNASKHHYFIVELTTSPPPATSSSSSSSSSGGGVPTTEETKIVSLIENVFKKIDFDSSKNFIKEIQIKANKKKTNMVISVNKYSVKPYKVTVPKIRNVYRYLQITHDGLNNSEIDEVKITFAVEKSWMTKNNESKNDVILLRYNDALWEDLDTEYYNSVDNYSYFTAKSEGMSYFSIGTKTKEDNNNSGVSEVDNNSELLGENVSSYDYVDDEKLLSEINDMIEEMKLALSEAEKTKNITYVQQKFQEGIRLYEEGQYDEARVLILEAKSLLDSAPLKTVRRGIIYYGIMLFMLLIGMVGIGGIIYMNKDKLLELFNKKERYVAEQSERKEELNNVADIVKVKEHPLATETIGRRANQKYIVLLNEKMNGLIERVGLLKRDNKTTLGLKENMVSVVEEVELAKFLVRNNSDEALAQIKKANALINQISENLMD